MLKDDIVPSLELKSGTLRPNGHKKAVLTSFWLKPQSAKLLSMRTVKAIIDEEGKVTLLEPVELGDKRQALVTILEDEPPKGLRPYGLAKGEFSVPDDFDAPLPDDILDDFEGV